MILKDALKERLITEAEYQEGVNLAWQVYDIALEDVRKKLEEKIKYLLAARKGDV